MRIKRLVAQGIVFYLIMVVALYFFQRNLIYFPDKHKPDPVQGAEIVKTAFL